MSPHSYLPLPTDSRHQEKEAPARGQGCYLPVPAEAAAHSALFMLTARSDDICKLTANILSTCWSVS